MERASHQNDETLDRLRRTDKHQLGAGDGVLFAPSRPAWLRRTGFWDGIQYFMHVLRPAFTLSLVDRTGRELRLRQVSRSWTPATLTAAYVADGVRVTEQRVILPGGRVAAEYEITNEATGPALLGIIAWTALEHADLPDRDSLGERGGRLTFRARAAHAQARDDEIALDCVLHLSSATGADRTADGWCIAETQHSRHYANAPEWDSSPLRDLWTGDRLPRVRRLSPHPPAGRTLIHLGVSRAIRLEPGETDTVTVCLDVAASDPQLRLQSPASEPDPGVTAADRSIASWSGFFADAASLRCSDPHIDRYFAYRWYGLRLNFLGPAGSYRRPTCAEGTGFFHAAVSYSAWCHARELRWLDPHRARGVIRTFLDHQRDDGSLPGIIYLNGTHPTASYFADWGASVLAVDEVHPDPAFLEATCGPLQRFAAHLDRTRDPERSGLYRVFDPYETGQETMSRYMAVDSTADAHHFDYRLRLLGVDITVYMYRLHRALARITARLGRSDDSLAHDARADRIAGAVRTHMWDPLRGMFSDIDPRSGERTGIRAAVCFMPWMTDIPGAGHVAGFERNLFDPSSFWTPFPVPSTAADDPTFDPDGFWKGVRQNCPWNGRVWPMANCHIAEALGTQATTHAPHLRSRAAGFISRFISMLCFDSDPTRPNAFEHYSPMTGRASTFRGLDDYQHSWINDLIVRWVIGFRPGPEGGFVLDPLPCGIERARLDRLPFRGERVSLEIEGDTVTASLAGERFTTRLGHPLEVRV